MNVGDFGATGDERTDDTFAIQSAINAVASAGGGCVHFPPGRYSIENIINIGVDNLNITGSPGTVIVEDIADPEDAFIPLLAQKNRELGFITHGIDSIVAELEQLGRENLEELRCALEETFPYIECRLSEDAYVYDFKEYDTEETGRVKRWIVVDGDRNYIIRAIEGSGTLTVSLIETIRNLTIKDITIEFLQAGPCSASGIQLNACVDFYVENVRIIGDGSGMNGSITNGISCSYHQSTGIFQGVIVKGLSKPGFYAADGSDIRFEGCVSKNCYATYPPPPDEPWKVPGFLVGNAKNVVLTNCQAYDNSGPGVQISCLGTVPSRPYSNVQIVGGHFHRNQHGILTGTQTSEPGKNLQIIGVDCSDNTSFGIRIAAAINVLITNCIAAQNQVGIFLTDIAPGQGIEDQTNLVTVRGCQIYNNMDYGIILRATNDVTVENSRIYHSVAGRQPNGIGIWYYEVTTDYGEVVPWLSGASRKKNTNVRIVDVDFHPMTEEETPINHLEGNESAVETGYYRLQSSTLGNPNGNVYAPHGSEYTDLQTGSKYLKNGGFDNENWFCIRSSESP